VIPTADAQIFDSRALAKFSGMAIVACMFFDLAYAFVLPMVTALPIEIIALLIWTCFLGWWSNAFRYTMKTAGLVLSFILPNMAMGFLYVSLTGLEIATKGWR
jgi:hypothetical protein